MPPPPSASARDVQRFLGAFGLAAILAAGYLFWLSGALGVHRGTATTARKDVVFGSDMSARVYNLSGAPAAGDRGAPAYSVSHPLLNQIWGTPGGWLERRIHRWHPEESHLLAARALVAVVAGCGIAAMFAAGFVQVGWKTVPLFAIYLLFSANVLVSVPEHMGLSNGVLSLVFAASLAPRARWRLIGLLGAGGLAAATTITNVVAPVLASTRYPPLRDLWRRVIDRIRRQPLILVVGLAMVIAGSMVATSRLSRTDTIVTQFLNVRLVDDPSSAVNILAAVAVYPAVAPTPRVTGPDDYRHLSYEPLTFRDFDVINAAGAMAWLVLLLVTVRLAWANTRPRDVLLMPIGWLAFNLVFHSLWGDEFFLFTPHWSWALMALVLLGCGSLRTSTVLALSALVGVGQVHSLRLIIEALESLPR